GYSVTGHDGGKDGWTHGRLGYSWTGSPTIAWAGSAAHRSASRICRATATSTCSPATSGGTSTGWLAIIPTAHSPTSSSPRLFRRPGTHPRLTATHLTA